MNASTSLFSQLNEPQLLTYRAIFAHPTTHTLPWREVRALFAALGQASEEPNGTVKLSFQGKSLVLQPSREKEVTNAADMVTLRRLLSAAGEAPVPVVAGSWLVVINHHEARVFHAVAPDSVAQLILPHGSSQTSHHTHQAKDFSRGREKPDPASFFAPLGQALASAPRILVCGSGKGAASEMAQFLTWTKEHHPQLAARIVGRLVIDEHHLTEAQILAKAREYYANSHRGAPRAKPALTSKPTGPMLTKFAIDYLLRPQHNKRIATHFTDDPIEAEDFLMHLLSSRARITEIRHAAPAWTKSNSTVCSKPPPGEALPSYYVSRWSSIPSKSGTASAFRPKTFARATPDKLPAILPC